MHDLFYNWYEYRASFGSIKTQLTTMTITERLGITLTALRLHTAASVRIPHSTYNFQYVLPTVRVTPLNLFSASTVNLHGPASSNIFRNNLQIRLSPLKSPILRKYILNRSGDLECTLALRLLSLHL